MNVILKPLPLIDSLSLSLSLREGRKRSMSYDYIEEAITVLSGS
jgi:hypothetical protein